MPILFITHLLHLYTAHFTLKKDYWISLDRYNGRQTGPQLQNLIHMGLIDDNQYFKLHLEALIDHWRNKHAEILNGNRIE